MLCFFGSDFPFCAENSVVIYLVSLLNRPPACDHNDDDDPQFPIFLLKSVASPVSLVLSSLLPTANLWIDPGFPDSNKLAEANPKRLNLDIPHKLWVSVWLWGYNSKGLIINWPEPPLPLIQPHLRSPGPPAGPCMGGNTWRTTQNTKKKFSRPFEPKSHIAGGGV